MGGQKLSRRIQGGTIGAILLTALIAGPAMAYAQVGGGQWDYGTSVTSGKHAWSNYYNYSYVHTSTSTCGAAYQKDRQLGGWWTQAETWCGAFEGAGAYWSNE